MTYRVILTSTEIRTPQFVETRLSNEVYGIAVHRIGILKQEAGPAIHTPTGEIKGQLECSLVTNIVESVRPGFPKVAVAVFP